MNKIFSYIIIVFTDSINFELYLIYFILLILLFTNDIFNELLSILIYLNNKK